MGLTSKHFAEHELACRCCGVNGMNQAALDVAEALRARLCGIQEKDVPVDVRSGFRCAERNAAEGGARGSQHLLGNALDISVKGMTAAELEIAARSIPEIHGIGRSDPGGYLHIDVRPLLPGQKIAEWCYQLHFNGKQWIERQIPYYPPKDVQR
jgi:hypothetical protein